MGKIKDFFNIIKNYSLLNFFLNKEEKALKKDIEFSHAYIIKHEKIIKEAELNIINSKDSIIMYKEDIDNYYDKIRDINKLK